MNQPNILFIIADQWRLDALGATGGWVKTPNLDALAGEGMLFTQCLTNSPVCIPARFALATGIYPHNSGIWGNVAHDLPAEAETWMQRVRSAGYRTSLFGKTHLHRHIDDLRNREHLMHAYGYDDVDEIAGPRRCMYVRSNMTELWEKRGLWAAYTADFEERFGNKPYVVRPSVLPLELYTDVYVGQQAKTYLQSYTGDQPWFCTVSFGGPHEPWDTPEPYASMYDPADMPMPIPKPQENGNRPHGFLDHLYETGNDHSPQVSAEEYAAMRANYAGNVTLIDEQIGEIIQTVKDRGEWANTVVVFVSDHGEMNGDHGLIYKENFHDSAVKVPLIVRTPEMAGSAAAGTRSEQMVEWFDIGPTLVELAGGEMEPRNAPQYAKSLTATLRDPSATHRAEAVSELHGETLIQTQEWKMALNKEGLPYLLYNVKRDPQETDNRIGDPACASVIAELQGRLLTRLAACPNYLIGKPV
jgi:choline-sulfatase